ncbi:NUDIX hydrolase [Pantoea sp. 18069]|uniref:NUDIX hydrolase n=1 Tax=Pantoea sp. 18069 TaxID=2681415 RepID=UPI001F41E7B1|nr:NUDIX hydrolase [Pantoea sp. 18069]
MSAIIERDGRFLLVEEETADGLKLNVPAGHLDPAESPIEACAREVLEETAFSFTPRALVGIYMNRFTRTRTGADITYVRFAFTGDLGTHHPERSLDDGVLRTVWMTLAELQASAARHRSPVVLQSVQDYLAGQRFDLGLLHVDASVYEVPGPAERGPTSRNPSSRGPDTRSGGRRPAGMLPADQLPDDPSL